MPGLSLGLESMSICIVCGAEHRRKSSFCCKACYMKSYFQSPGGKRAYKKAHDKSLKKPEFVAKGLERLNNYRIKKTDEAYDRLINPRCEIDGTHCITDEQGMGRCGDATKNCIWNSHRQKTPVKPAGADRS